LIWKFEMEDKVVRRRRGALIHAAEEANADLRVTEVEAVKSWISTGCTVLDLAISGRYPGGIPLGRTVQVYGAGSTCKTVLGMTILGSVQRKGGIAFFADSEHTFDPKWAQLFGLNCSDPDIWRYGFWWEKDKKDLVVQPTTIEELFDIYLKKIVSLDDNRPKVVVVDSLTSLPSNVELDTKMEDGTYGTSRPKQINLGVRKYLSAMTKSNTSIFFIDQTRDKLGVAFGEKETVSGGRALEFYSSVRIHLKHQEAVKNKKKQEVGIWVGFKIVKNKVAPPFKKGSFKIIWDYGLDDVGSNVDFLKEFQDNSGDTKEKSGRVVFQDKSYYTNQLINHIEENNLEQELIQEVVRCWNEYFQTDERKPRTW
jgi:recombination protein RecA